MAISKSLKKYQIQWNVHFGNLQQFMGTNVNETIEWLGLCFINKECKKYERNKIMYSEICKILFFKKKIQIISLIKFKLKKSSLTHY